tara:strand:+ start:707 stop:1309 length:603 start_codon:yes stop_codon:yes gene_type:complete
MQCGLSLQYSERALEQCFNARMQIPFLYTPYYYLGSETFPDLYCIPEENPTEIIPLELGLVSSEIDDIFLYRLQNSTCFKDYRESLDFKKCLILATGIILPETSSKGVVPKLYELGFNTPFCIAGVYEEIKPEYYTGAILIRDQFPVVIHLGLELEYLSGTSLSQVALNKKDLSSTELKTELYTTEKNFNTKKSFQSLRY